ncbi:hypothetical protein AQUCO_03000193v1 [Aquilegia coerulea]|uniref:Protein FATTY ACID EXPORT 3, chloroplastic n=1 Tax=Aquilegia coerulea TaxID=218851 RepID=A0A2G5D1R6_AQUCA|nr:hypothetical protein AQUCO_03000193v1 [Aquilegia coerulea]PIA37444.1 hypothetical protein AQUCO_03000193v1 [Aquilegia coerulea]PIA37445.1 hypothetical protein AQUCO_03000193v1 [Aquilegia coerulea]PIA37447.1 hypothetical protein AQUCO_03000193v1 [Aquilegia coerulea]PIA37448.1 hypothetical protein AQUCO_03000193v1 [Aquilegia coerulea]
MALSHHLHSSSSPTCVGIEAHLHRSGIQKISLLLPIKGLPSSSSSSSSAIPSLSLHAPNRGSFKKKKNNRYLVSFAASQEDSKHSEIEVEKEKSEVDAGANESQEAWERMLDSFKEQAVKMQGMSKEAYEEYSKKAVVILNETSKKLKIQAEKTSQDLSKIAKEISEESKEYLSEAANNSPEEMKDIVETFASSTDDLKEVSKLRDFYLGIPYGTILSVGGFLSFMITGSTSAIRFGVILGGALLFLSISSLRSWKKHESSSLALKGQTAIAAIIFLRQLHIVSQRATISSSFTTLISGAMAMFYLYRIMVDGDKSKGLDFEGGSES